MWPYGPFTAANQCGTQIVIKVGAEHRALGSFWLQDLGNWLWFHTAAGRNFLPAAVWRTRANLEWPVATKRSLLTAMMREKNNDTWSSRNFFFIYHLFFLESSTLITSGNKYITARKNECLPVFLCSVLLPTLANQPGIFPSFPILHLIQCPLLFLTPSN